MPPMTVNLKLNWLQYFLEDGSNPSAVAVQVQLNAGVPTGLLDSIRGIKIDNTNSSISVSVYFPDTGDVVTCAPQSITTASVMTNQQNCYVIAQGLSAGFTPITNIYLTNFLLPNATDTQEQVTFPQYIGSPTIQRSTLLTPGFGSPALGDQFQSVARDVPSTIALWGCPRASGFIVLTSFQLIGFAFLAGSAGGSVMGKVTSNGVAGNLFGYFWNVTSGYTSAQNLIGPIGGNIKLDATASWTLNIDAISGGGFNTGGGIYLHSVFSFTEM